MIGSSNLMCYTKNEDKFGVNLFIKKDELKKELSIKDDNDRISIVLFLRIFEKKYIMVIKLIIFKY